MKVDIEAVQADNSMQFVHTGVWLDAQFNCESRDSLAVLHRRDALVSCFAMPLPCQVACSSNSMC